LEYVREAIDTFTRYGFPMIPTVETAFEEYKTLKHTSLDPPSDKQFYDWVERSWFQGVALNVPRVPMADLK
jgi:hypothetical protein